MAQTNILRGMTYHEAQARTDRDQRTLGAEFLRRVKRNPRKLAVMDFRGEMSRLRLAAVALSIFPLLELADDEERVGVVLPPGQGGTLVNLSLALAGRCAVNLNHTTGDAQLARMAKMAGLRTIISSKLYLSKIGEPSLPGRVILAEDLIPKLSKPKVLANMAKIMALPVEKLDKSRPEQLVTIIFSSGSTADPKGIQITHQQIAFICDSVREHVELEIQNDVLASPLPLFHSFGYIVGMWMGLVFGLPMAHQADPRDGRALGKLCEESGATILLSTPTFVRGYMRRIEPEQLATLRFGVVGAERCPEDLKETFREKYGAELLEGYGTTELVPAASVNNLNHNRAGSVGRPLPGVEIFTMDPETEEILPQGEEGLLVVRSPARMVGYLGRPDLTEQSFVHGGYNTGDIGRVDEDGFVFITGRLARFAKIGGEMVPLDKVESAIEHYLDETYPEEAQTIEVAVGAVRSRRKGERLLVMHTGLPCEPKDLLEGLKDLPAIFKPKAGDFHEVDELPVLGTGKRNLGEIANMAQAIADGKKGSILGRLKS